MTWLTKIVRKCPCAKCDFAVRQKQCRRGHKEEEHEVLASKQHVGWSILWKIVRKCLSAKWDFAVRHKEYCRQHVKGVHEALASRMWHYITCRTKNSVKKRMKMSVWYMHFCGETKIISFVTHQRCSWSISEWKTWRAKFRSEKVERKCPRAKCDFAVRQKKSCRHHVKEEHEALACGICRWTLVCVLIVKYAGNNFHLPVL